MRAGSGDLATLVEVAGLARDAGVLGVVVDATAVHDLGASDAQELGYSLAVGAAYLRALTDAGWSVDEALATIEFRYAATDEQFPTIAKLRAARRLWSRVAELSEGTPEAAGQRQHAVTSRPMMSKYDPWVNMLRTTVAAFAAGVGGADAVTVLPFDAALGAPGRVRPPDRPQHQLAADLRVPRRQGRRPRRRVLRRREADRRPRPGRPGPSSAGSRRPAASSPPSTTARCRPGSTRWSRSATTRSPTAPAR